MRRVRTRWTVLVALATLVALAATAAPGSAHNKDRQRTQSPVSWEWDSSSVVGRSTLVRSPHGLQVKLKASGLTPGDVVTMWIGFFTNPDECSATPCPRPADVRNPATGADLYWGDGVVVGKNGKATFRGMLRVGQDYGSLKDEVGLAPGVRLTDPFGSEVAIALHSHGPALEGDALHEQLTSFLGGCEVFTGGGFAGGFEDLPDEIGECTTFQSSIHLP